MKRWLACGAGLLMSWTAAPAQSRSNPGTDLAWLDRPVAAPVATLGRPLAASACGPAAPTPEPIRQVAHVTSPATTAGRVVFRGQSADLDEPSPFTPPTERPVNRSRYRDSEERYLRGEPERRSTYSPSVSRSNHTSRFGELISEQFHEWFPNFNNGDDGTIARRNRFESDHCFEYMISPITNPFLFEDPRALTEIRPIFMYQRIPGANPTFLGGHAEFYGTQLRVAFSNRFSLVMNKLGGVNISPGANSAIPSGTGFAEVHLGPKFTFLRNIESRAIGAMGLTFQIPTGRASVFQDTGNLSLVPYVSVGKNFFETSWGSFNVLDTLGYSFATDSQRTNYLFNSLHLDFDVMNYHRFFPLVELNWFNYTRSGTARPFGTEGADLANIGSMGVGGKNNLLLAVGARYKFSERWQAGIATEFALLNRRDLNNFRLSVDLIWRY